MIEELIVDSNVLYVANGVTPQASLSCIRACARELNNVPKGFRPVLDRRGLILREYRRVDPRPGQRRPGDVFYKWVARNFANEDLVRLVEIHPHTEREFVEFPEDQRLADFDRDDRKFVAVALASGTSPPIVNASDTDWWEHCEALQAHGIEILFFCPELMPQR